MYTFPDQVNWTAHFLFDKKMITELVWANLPSAAKSVFPVIGVHRNDRGYAYPTKKTIAILCGRTEKTVGEGIHGLQQFLAPLEFSYHITEKGRRAKKYHLETPPPGDDVFPFYRCLMEKGLWQHLSPSAQALYPVMRCFGFFDQKSYKRYQPDDQTPFPEIAMTRDYDYCLLAMGQLAELSGISRQTVKPALQSLISCDLIQVQDKDPGGDAFLWKVFFKTESWFPRDLLNKNAAKRYGRKLL